MSSNPPYFIMKLDRSRDVAVMARQYNRYGKPKTEGAILLVVTGKGEASEALARGIVADLNAAWEKMRAERLA